jgi:hypothetical protein
MPEGIGEFGVCSLMAEQDYTRGGNSCSRKEIGTETVKIHEPPRRRLTAQEPLPKIEAWKIPSVADLPRSPFPIAMGGTFVLALCGPGNRPFWFFCGTTAEFFAASTSRSCANTGKPSATEEPRLPPLD